MSLKQFNFELPAKGDFSEIKAEMLKAKKGKGEKDFQNLLYAVDAAANNPQFLADFEDGFSREWGKKVSFRTLNENEKEMQANMIKFDSVQANIAVQIGTTILPTIEHLVKSTELLGLVDLEKVGGNQFYQMFDFDAEQVGAILSETAIGSDVDEVLRSGDLLIPKYKAQASFKISEFAINNMQGQVFGKYIARGASRVVSLLINGILYSGNGATNGTAKNSLRGIKNNFGTNGTGDTTGTIGAIVYASKATADTAITTAGGVASTDKYDLAVKAKELLLPPNLVGVEEDQYIYVMNRASWGAISTIQDLNGRYKAQTMIDPATGKAMLMLEGARVLIDPRVATNEVFLFPPKFYTLIIQGDILSLNDNGVVELRGGLTSFVFRAWVDGSMEYAQKFRPTTPVVIGTTVPDNAAQNAFLVFNLA